MRTKTWWKAKKPIAASRTETVRVCDIGHGTASLVGVLHVCDVLQAEMTGTVAGGGLARAVGETLHLRDAATGSFAEMAEIETVCVRETVRVERIGIGAGLGCGLTETLRLCDVGHGVASMVGVLHVRDLLQAEMRSGGTGGGLARAVGEALHLRDAATGSFVELTDTETIRLQDTVRAERIVPVVPLAASRTETIRVCEVGHGVATLVGVIHVRDTLQAARVEMATGTTLGCALSESIRVDDRWRVIYVSGIQAERV